MQLFRVNTMGKVFFAALGAWLVGRLSGIKIRGTQEEINAIANAMMASKRFQDELNRDGATVDSVVQKLGLKNASIKEFERILQIRWPL